MTLDLVMDQRKEKKNVHIPKSPFSILILYSKQPKSLLYHPLLLLTSENAKHGKLARG